MGFKENLTKNIGWKIGGLVMALALWFHLATEKTYDKTFAVDIEVIGLSPDLQLRNPEPPKALVTITGTGKQLIKLSLVGDLKLVANLSSVKQPGRVDHRFNIADLVPIDPSQYRRITFAGDGIFVFDIIEKS